MPVDFHEVQLSPKVSYGCHGGPRYRTRVITTDSGGEQRLALWSQSHGRWTVSLTRKKVDVAAVLAFFHARRGMLYGFRFKDWTDYVATTEPLVNTGAATLQLQKTYADIAGGAVRKIVKPVVGTVSLQRGGADYPAAGNWTLDATSGIVTLTAAQPGAVFTWSGQFDVPVRFDIDDMDITRADWDENNWDNIPVVELLL